MPGLKEKLAEANKEVDRKIDLIWAEAESNLKQLEKDYLKRKEVRSKD